jgi:uncharacterized phage protein gp47/JayE
MNQIPTLRQLSDSIVNDIQTNFGNTLPSFGKVALRAIANMQAGAIWLLYLCVGNVQKNIFVDTAEDEAIGGTLQRFGRVKLNRNPYPAVAAQYHCAVTGNASAVIKASTTFKSDDTSASPGILYVLDNDYTCTGSSDVILLRCLTAGIAGKLLVNDTLTATSPIANVNRVATVANEAVTPLAAETLEQYRAKALQAYRLEPQGGAGTDYRLWASDAQGVAQTYPYAKSGYANEINVFVESVIADSPDGKGTPPNSMLTEVANVIEFDPDTTKPLSERGRRPLGVFQVHVLPITPVNVDIVINGYQNRTAASDTSIINEITSVINNIRPFVASADILANKNDILDINKIIAAIFTVKPGSVFGTINLSVSGAPVTSYTFTQGNIPFVNSITFA